ncbi:hypothetical protein FRC06_004936, partial [Ceratobasidium sp. 370]
MSTPQSILPLVALPDGQMLAQPPEPSLAELYAMPDLQAWSHPAKRIVASVRLMWRSPVYEHYVIGLEHIYRTDPNTGAEIRDYMEFTFTCMYDPINCKKRRRKRQATAAWGTQNLIKAVQQCDRRRGVPDSVTAPPLDFSQTTFRAMVAM